MARTRNGSMVRVGPMMLGKDLVTDLKDDSQPVNAIRREAKGLLGLFPWILLAIVAVAALWRVDLSATGGLFQSPPPGGGGSGQSPLATPTIRPTVAVPTVVPTQPPPPTSTPAASVVPTELPPPTQTPPPTPTATPVVPTGTPLPPTPTPVMPTVAPATATEVPLPSSTPAESGEAGRYPEGEPNLRFEWGMLFDSVALGLSYIWLCCGLVVLLAVPTFFVVLWVVGKRRRTEE